MTSEFFVKIVLTKIDEAYEEYNETSENPTANSV